MTLNYFLYTVNCSLNNYLQDLWSEMAISLKLLNLRTLEYRLQLTAKASIDTYIIYFTTICCKTGVPEKPLPDHLEA